MNDPSALPSAVPWPDDGDEATRDTLPAPAPSGADVLDPDGRRYAPDDDTPIDLVLTGPELVAGERPWGSLFDDVSDLEVDDAHLRTRGCGRETR